MIFKLKRSVNRYILRAASIKSKNKSLNDFLLMQFITAKRSWLQSFHKKADKHRWDVDKYNSLKQVITVGSKAKKSHRPLNNLFWGCDMVELSNVIYFPRRDRCWPRIESSKCFFISICIIARS